MTLSETELHLISFKLQSSLELCFSNLFRLVLLLPTTELMIKNGCFRQSLAFISSGSLFLKQFETVWNCRILLAWNCSAHSLSLSACKSVWLTSGSNVVLSNYNSKLNLIWRKKDNQTEHSEIVEKTTIRNEQMSPKNMRIFYLTLPRKVLSTISDKWDLRI
jgi:hypothetical protein